MNTAAQTAELTPAERVIAAALAAALVRELRAEAVAGKSESQKQEAA